MKHNDKNLMPRPMLRLVLQDEESRNPSKGVNQYALFPEVDASVMSFFHTAFLKKASLYEIVRQSSPAVMFDVRAVPSFRHFYGERRNVLSFLEKHEVEYVDVVGIVGSRTFSTSTLDLIQGLICSHIASRLLHGPVFFVFDNFEMMNHLAETLPNVVSKKKDMPYRAHVFVGDLFERDWL